MNVTPNLWGGATDFIGKMKEKLTTNQKIKHRATAAFAAVVSLLATGLFAVPACPDPVTVTQHDGEVVTVRLRGDERMSWHEDADGFTIVLDEATKDWCYAKLNADGTALVSTGVRVAAKGETVVSRPVSERHVHPAPRTRAPGWSRVATNGVDRSLAIGRPTFHSQVNHNKKENGK